MEEKEEDTVGFKPKKKYVLTAYDGQEFSILFATIHQVLQDSGLEKKHGFRAWNKVYGRWKARRPNTSLELTDIQPQHNSLRGADLRDLILRAEFTDSSGKNQPTNNVLRGTDLRGAKIQGTDFRGTSLKGCIFESEEQAKLAKDQGAILDEEPNIQALEGIPEIKGNRPHQSTQATTKIAKGLANKTEKEFVEEMDDLKAELEAKLNKNVSFNFFPHAPDAPDGFLVTDQSANDLRKLLKAAELPDNLSKTFTSQKSPRKAYINREGVEAILAAIKKNPNFVADILAQQQGEGATR